VHGPGGLGGARLPSSDRALAGEDAAEFLLDVSFEQNNLWLVAIGPLTNVAMALERDPDYASRIAGISIMGGSTTGGNVTASAEFNIWADPEAADIVFRSGAEIRLCGLNLTHQFKTSDELLGRLRAATGARALFAADLLTFLHDRMADLTGERRAALHDPCAVLAVTHPELFEFRRRPVAVELEGALTRGMTVVDERFSGRDSGHDRKPAADVAYRIDAASAMDHLLAALED
jgi:inosine-uridine nucleoside N-ribohydrolase